MSKFEYNAVEFALKFDFMCKCGNSQKMNFIIDNEKPIKTILCSECERKYEVRLEFREVN